MLLNDETKKQDSIALQDSSVSVTSSINPLQKYAPNPLDVNFRNTTNNTSSDHERLKTRGRDRPKSSLTSRKLVNQVDNPNDYNYNSFSSSKYRSISCEDARQALNESLMKVCSMQNMLETRR